MVAHRRFYFNHVGRHGQARGRLKEVGRASMTGRAGMALARIEAEAEAEAGSPYGAGEVLRYNITSPGDKKAGAKAGLLVTQARKAGLLLLSKRPSLLPSISHR